MHKASLEKWRRLYQTALIIKQLEPWNWMSENDIFGVKNPKTGEIAYCCVTGQLGEYFALNVYLGTEGLQGYKKIASGQTNDKEMLFIMRLLSVSFEDRQYLQKEDTKIMDDIGLKFHGDKVCPLFRSYQPGFHPWFLTATEVDFLTLVLEQAQDIIKRFQVNRKILISMKKEEYLTRVQDQSGMWGDEWIRPEPLIEQKIKKIEINPQEIILIKEMIKKNEIQPAGEWEIDYFYHPKAVQGKKEERPFFPKNLIFAHHDSYFIFYARVLDSSQDPIIEFIQYIKNNDKKIYPQTILVKKRELYDNLKNICAELNINLKQTGDLKAIADIKKHMNRALGGLNKNI